MSTDKPNVLRRLATIQGHLNGVRKMVEADAACGDILKQTYAVKRAIATLEGVLVRAHIADCFRAGSDTGRQADVIQELNDIFELSRK